MLIFQGVSKISHMIYNQVLYIQTVVFSPDFFQQFVSPKHHFKYIDAVLLYRNHHF